MSNICRVILSLFFSVVMVQPCYLQEKIVEGGKTYLLHKIQKGEGFYRLSVIYGVSQKDIVDANPEMALQGLKEGSLVKIPQKAQSAAKVPAPVVQEGFINHTVEKGETLYSISRRYNVAMDLIIQANQLTNNDLAVGSVLRIPKDSSPNKDIKPVEPKSDDKYIIHTIVPSETLYRISLQYQVPVAQIEAANPFLDINAIKPGTQVRIPKIAQETEQSEDPVFLFHKVQPGESLFAIGTKYSRSVTELKLANEKVVDGNLSVGQTIKVPKQPVNLQLFRNSLFLTHEVKRKETIFGISKTYNADIDVLKLVNPDVDFASIKKGQNLRIPTKNWYAEIFKSASQTAEKTDIKPAGTLPNTVSPCSTTRYTEDGDQINVAVMLPFDYAGYNLVKNTPDSLKTDFHRSLISRSKPFIEFYEGVLLALDSLRQIRTSVNLYVYDSQSDTANFDKMLGRPEFARMNLIIGPAYSANMKTVAHFAKENKIPVVFPFSAVDGVVLRNNQYVYQASPVDTLYQSDVVSRQLSEIAGKKVFVLTTGGSHQFETSIVKKIKQELALLPADRQGNVVFHRYVQRELSSLEAQLDPSNENIIIIPSIEEAKVSRMLTNLGLLSDRSKIKISVWGFSDWLKFQTFETEDLHKLNVTLYSAYGADFASDAVKRFSGNYRQWFQTEPVAFNPYFQKVGSSSGYSRYGMWGYDVTMYFVGAVRLYGQHFQKCLDNYSAGSLQSNFSFRHLTNWGGAYNQGLIRINFTRDFQTIVTPVK